MKAERYDAVVVGGGPAGAIAALLFARRAWRVLLVEKQRRNREKACGRCLSPHAIDVIHRLGLRERLQAVAGGETSVLDVVCRQSRILRTPLRHGGKVSRGWVVKRAVFDQVLRDLAAEAGVSVLYESVAKINHLDSHLAEINVTGPDRSFDLTVPLLIGADGLGSRVARAAGLADRTSAGRRFGFALDAPPHTPLEPGVIRMCLTDHGYLGAVRDSDHLHVAGLFHATRDAQLNEILRSAGIERDDSQPVLGAGPMPWRPREVARGVVALVGDAAGYEEPFTGEGMHWAIRSAEILGEAVGDRLPGAWDEACAVAYRRRWRATIGRAQRSCRRVAALVSSPIMCRAVGRIFATFPFAERLTVRHFVPVPC